MSILSRLKSLFGGGSTSESDPPAIPQESSVPKVKKPVIQETITDQHYVRLKPKTNTIASGVICDHFDGSGSQIRVLPDDLVAHHRLDLVNCKELAKLPDGLSTPSINLSGCTALEHLPRGMRVSFLNLSGCAALREIPDDLRISGGILDLSGCQRLSVLPDGLGEVAGLDLNGCTGISALPRGLKVTSWVDITGTGIRTLPETYAFVGFRRGNEVISAEEALAG